MELHDVDNKHMPLKTIQPGEHNLEVYSTLLATSDGEHITHNGEMMDEHYCEKHGFTTDFFKQYSNMMFWMKNNPPKEG